MKKLITLPVLTLIASCGSNDEVASGTFQDSDGNESSFSMNGDDDSSETVIKSEDGEVRLSTGTKAASDLPMGVKLYPGADVQTSIKSDSNGKAGAMVVFKSKDDQDDVIAFYRNQMESMGIKVQTEISTGEMKMIGGEQKDGQVLNVSVTKDGDGGVITNLLIGGS